MMIVRLREFGGRAGVGTLQRAFLLLLVLATLTVTHVACRDESVPVVAKASMVPVAHAARWPQVTVVNVDALADMLESSQGSIVVVNLWATWCKPCLEEMPELARFYRKSANHPKKGVRFLSVSADAPVNLKQSVEPYLRENKIPFPVLVVDAESPEELVEVLGLGDTEWDGALPATFVFDETGSLEKAWLSEVTQKELQESLASLRG